jgi:hypothetical protein
LRGSCSTFFPEEIFTLKLRFKFVPSEHCIEHFSSTQSRDIVEQADVYHILKDSLKIQFNIIIALTSLSGPFHLRFPDKQLYEFFISSMYITRSALLILLLVS